MLHVIISKSFSMTSYEAGPGLMKVSCRALARPRQSLGWPGPLSASDSVHSVSVSCSPGLQALAADSVTTP